jgi:diaminopimelate decarboxylase
MLATRLSLFPLTTAVNTTANGQALAIGGFDLNELAAQYGTPLYVYDQATMDAAANAYREAFARHYPAEAGVTFAGKALLLTAAAQWVQRQGFLLDCTGAGELHIATNADLSPHQILVHGVNKSDEDLIAAVEHGGVIVVDNPTELSRLAQIAAEGRALPELWLRVRPGIAVDTHAYRQTGQHDSKFGFSVEEAINAVGRATKEGLPVTGFHFHQGSQFFDPAPIAPGLNTVLDLVQTLHQRHGWLPKTISPGGGWGVAYHEDELPQPSVDTYIAFIAQRLIE